MNRIIKYLSIYGLTLVTGVILGWVLKLSFSCSSDLLPLLTNYNFWSGLGALLSGVGTFLIFLFGLIKSREWIQRVHYEKRLELSLNSASKIPILANNLKSKFDETLPPFRECANKSEKRIKALMEVQSENDIDMNLAVEINRKITDEIHVTQSELDYFKKPIKEMLDEIKKEKNTFLLFGFDECKEVYEIEKMVDAAMSALHEIKTLSCFSDKLKRRKLMECVYSIDENCLPVIKNLYSKRKL